MRYYALSFLGLLYCVSYCLLLSEQRQLVSTWLKVHPQDLGVSFTVLTGGLYRLFVPTLEALAIERMIVARKNDGSRVLVEQFQHLDMLTICHLMQIVFSVACTKDIWRVEKQKYIRMIIIFDDF